MDNVNNELLVTQGQDAELLLKNESFNLILFDCIYLYLI